ncbi:hypothetical protein ABT337_09725 [Saccharopolyspora hirsuta]|uniref:Uncharacterized protein n=1 Tax=Saccharopolyspora hirsuta TaxID=1837 RepID=A0A5M7BKA3_SACHI|nr:hypothetical protein [Saccharopolyspora hirsuta]KAA5830079.1 hypothetical protein F1721_23515 [Saccharopolyspora hirsuta]MBF6507479.1 hypothetical protein [Nocardia farcinica]
MSENHSEFHDPQGPIHSGSGDQNIYLYDSIRESVRAQARGRRRTPSDDLRWLKQRFVAPPGLAIARTTLADARTALLTGPPGCGRRTAATMLLHELAGDRAPLTELEDEAADPDASLSAVKVLPRHLFVLDMSSSNEAVFRARQRELLAFRAEVQKADGHLVVVLPGSLAHHVEAELSRYIVRIERPDGREVLAAHLAAEQITLPTDRLDHEDVEQHLTASMAEITNLARMTVEARRSDPGGDAESWFLEAISACTDRRGEVAEVVGKHARGRARSVLLAAAMCRGATSDAVFFASHRLVKQLGFEEEPRLEQDGHHDHLVSLGIEVTADGRVEFDKLGYDQAARDYFWDSYPDLRKRFCGWVHSIIRDPLFTGRDRMNLVDHVVAASLRTNSPAHVRWLIEQWVFPESNARSNPLQDFGVRALIAGLSDERHGRFFRRMVWEWSTSDDLPAAVGQILVEVCTEVIAPRFPAQALVRLHQRARREDGRGDPTARQALLELTSTNPTLWRLLLDRLANDAARDNNWPMDLYLFLALADPTHLIRGDRPLITDAVVRPQLVFLWYRAMVAAGAPAAVPDPVRHRVSHWLAAAVQPAPRDLLLGLLVEAAQQNLPLLGFLHVSARDWSHAGDGRAEVAMRLSQLIDLAQGLQPTDYLFDRMPQEAAR